MTIDDLDRLLPAVLEQYVRERRPPTLTAIARTVEDLRRAEDCTVRPDSTREAYAELVAIMEQSR